MPPKNIEELIIRFFEARCVRPGGEKIFHIKMTRMAKELNDSRLDISKALNNLESEGLLHLQRERIFIPALEKLLSR
uniref:helix-turn-helix domain-containing protein n=1 Tax=Segatella hominis TaxID=2518605 RepID=UPI0040387B96